jgi:uncharacterized protein (TIGR02270 family)
VDDAAILASNRLSLVEAPHPRLERLSEYDRRLAAHLAGLGFSGEEGWIFCEAALENPSPGAIFTVAVRALVERDDTRLSRTFALAQSVSETSTGLLSAFEWVERARLQGIVASLLRDRDAFRRMIGVGACAMHRVDPGLASGELLRDVDSSVRARSLRAAGELGLSEARPTCVAALTDEDEDCRFWATTSAVLLGDRDRGVAMLMQTGLSPGKHRAPAFRLALQALEMSVAHDVLRQRAKQAQSKRWLIQGSGIVGDPAYMPWLVKQMGELSTARLAGEAFSMITGVHLGQAGLDRPAPENFEPGPNDDPDDPNVATDPDDGLSWPDVAKIEKWWMANGARFTPGIRCFMGAPLTREHCIRVLKNGYQRQRMLAAHYLCLLEPGTPLFNTSAPAWRQRRMLAALG